MLTRDNEVVANFLVGILHITTSRTTDISRNVCFETALAFVKKYHSFEWCDTFYADEAMNKLKEDGNTCKKFCEVSVNDLNNYGQNYLKAVKLKLDDYYLTRLPCRFMYADTGIAFLLSCNSTETGLFWSRSNFGENRQCFKWTQYSYVCWCGNEFVLINGNCLRGRKLVGETCESDLQCTGSEHSGLCSDGVCSCQNGYFQHGVGCFLESTSNNMGPILGALFGGLLLGVIITSGTVYLIYRRSNYSINERMGPRVTFAVNDAYGGVGHDDTINNTSTNKTKDKQKKVFNVSPLTRSEEWSEYRNTSGTVTAMDDVYNHLNEKEKTQDEDTYDHACAAAGRGHRDLDDYSNINGMDDDVVSGGTNNDDYSTLRQT